jgi:hypothetical protein
VEQEELLARGDRHYLDRHLNKMSKVINANTTSVTYRIVWDRILLELWCLLLVMESNGLSVGIHINGIHFHFKVLIIIVAYRSKGS